MTCLAHIAVVDDDREIRDLLTGFLVGNGYCATTATDARAMDRALAEKRIHLVVLDIMMPGEDGLSVCRRLRAASGPPVILLSARGEEIDRILGLEMGADDYLSKPFNPRELLVRAKAVLRRYPTGEEASMVPSSLREATSDPTVFLFSGWRFDPTSRALTAPDGLLLSLTKGESDLLAMFASRPRHVLSREQLMGLARTDRDQPFDRAVDLQIHRLRRKIEGGADSSSLIRTIPGGGYMFTPNVSREPE
ncbi:MAG: response regulator [Rhodospirillales bacterium]|nr:response regulator [Rhodospirillales bacterium]